jgi:hypothetical protein
VFTPEANVGTLVGGVVGGGAGLAVFLILVFLLRSRSCKPAADPGHLTTRPFTLQVPLKDMDGSHDVLVGGLTSFVPNTDYVDPIPALLVGGRTNDSQPALDRPFLENILSDRPYQRSCSQIAGNNGFNSVRGDIPRVSSELSLTSSGCEHLSAGSDNYSGIGTFTIALGPSETSSFQSLRSGHTASTRNTAELELRVREQNSLSRRLKGEEEAKRKEAAGKRLEKIEQMREQLARLQAEIVGM